MVTDLEKWLMGAWDLQKEIYDHLAQQQGSFKGQAFFEEIEPHKARYGEEGELHYAAHHGSATQEYIYEFPHPYEAKIYRPQHRFFHDLDLRLGFWKIEHICAQDHYKGRFTVETQNNWTIDWDIKGPQKKLTMKYLYQRK
jgi:hypothetical protein